MSVNPLQTYVKDAARAAGRAALRLARDSGPPLQRHFKWYLQNLRCGARYAFFFSAREKFVGSWHMLAAVAATLVASQWAVELAAAGADSELAYSWYDYHACLFTLSLLLSYAVGSFACSGGRVLDVAVAFLSSYYYVFMLYAAAVILAPGWLFGAGFWGYVQYGICGWGFAVMCRIALANMFARSIARAAICGLLAAGVLYVLNAHVFLTRFYYDYDKSEAAQPSALDTLTAEELFGMQPALREKALAGLKVSRKGVTDIYAIAFGSHEQDVFKRDVSYAAERMRKKLGVTNVVSMINNRATVETVPLANASNLKFTLEKLASGYMQPDEDILLLFMTSHGGQESGLSVSLAYKFGQRDIPPATLAKMLKEAGIRNKVVIISACHSGIFVPALQDDHSIVMTAAAAGRVSFGCSDANNLTYFTEAYFMTALGKTTGIEKAFAIAKETVAKRETSEQITELSDPQISVGGKINNSLRKYKGARLVAEDK